MEFFNWINEYRKQDIDEGGYVNFINEILLKLIDTPTKIQSCGGFRMKDEFITQVGIWRQRHYNYLKSKSPTVVNVMRMEGKLEQHLIDINSDTTETYDLLVRQYDEIEGGAESFKTTGNLEWTRRMNSILNRVEGFVLSNLIYA